MGCILGVVGFIWKAIKFVFGAIIKAVEVVVNTFIDLGLGIPFLGAIAIFFLWLFGVVEYPSDVFVLCWVLLAALTVTNIIFKIRRRRRKRQQEREREEAIRRYEQEKREERGNKRGWFR